MNRLHSGDIVVIAGARLKYQSANIFYKFRQATNFWYLTGFEEPDSVVVLGQSYTLARIDQVTDASFCV